MNAEETASSTKHISATSPSHKYKQFNQTLDRPVLPIKKFSCKDDNLVKEVSDRIHIAI